MTGKELWQVADDLPLVPASTNKVLTAAAALLTLDRQARISTRVVAGSQNAQGPIVLVGAGDPTLSAAPPGRTRPGTGVRHGSATWWSRSAAAA